MKYIRDIFIVSSFLTFPFATAAKKAMEKEEYQKELERSGKMKKYVERKNKKVVAKEKKKKAWIMDQPS